MFRFILHNDDNNPTLSSLEAFESSLSSFKPDLLVVGGLQMMDNYPFTKGISFVFVFPYFPFLILYSFHDLKKNVWQV